MTTRNPFAKDLPEMGREARYLEAMITAVPMTLSEARHYILRAVMAVADAEHAQLWDVIEANGDTNARLMRERDKARAEVEGSERELDRVRAERDAANAERDATIERLWAQLNEATNVPDTRCLACDDPHCGDRP